MASIISDYQSQRKEKNINEFLSSLTIKLQEHEAKLSELSHGYILNDDFLDIFENTIRKVIYERQRDKRIAYSNIIANSIVNELGYDETELFQRLINVLTPLHKQVLRAFSSHKKQEDENHTAFCNKVMDSISSFADFTDYLLEEIVGDLETRNLIHNFLGTLAVANGAGGKSYEGECFVITKGFKLLSYTE